MHTEIRKHKVGTLPPVFFNAALSISGGEVEGWGTWSSKARGTRSQSYATETWCKLWIVPTCWLLQVVSRLLIMTSSSCIKSVNIRLDATRYLQTCCRPLQVDETTCIKPVCSSQLAASLLTICNRFVIIKPEQAMRTHPDIGLVIADLMEDATLSVLAVFRLYIVTE